MKIQGDYLFFTGLLTTQSRAEHDRMNAIDPVCEEMVEYMHSCQTAQWERYPLEYGDKDKTYDMWLHSECLMLLPITQAYEMPHGYCRVYNAHDGYYVRGDIEELKRLCF